MPYKLRVYHKVATNVLLTDYTELCLDMNLEAIIQMLAHVMSIEGESLKVTGKHSNSV